MASPSAIPKKPTAVEFLKLISGPRVDVFVGEKKELYNLPKDLLSYYSTYFEKCFNGGFKEDKEQKLELLEDQIEHFEILLEVLLRGCIPDTPDFLASSASLVDFCMLIIAYADKYNMGEIVCELLYDTLKVRLKYAEDTATKFGRIPPEHVELIFRVARDGNPIRTLIVQDVMSSEGLNGSFQHGKEFKLKEKEIPDFAFEMLQQFRRSKPIGTWTDPFSGRAKKIQ